MAWKSHISRVSRPFPQSRARLRSFTPGGPFASAGCLARANLKLQVPVREVVFLEPPEARPDLPRPDRPDSLDALQISLGGPDDCVERTEVVDDPMDDRIGKPRDVRKHPVAARRDGEVQRIDRALVAEELDETVELEQVAISEAAELRERRS